MCVCFVVVVEYDSLLITIVVVVVVVVRYAWRLNSAAQVHRFVE